MEIRYTATPDDVGAVLRHNLRHSPRFLMTLVAMMLFPAALYGLFGLLSRGQVTAREVLNGLWIGLVASAVLVVTRLRAKRDERVLKIDGGGIATSVGELSGRVSWREIAAVDLTPDYIFITGKNTNAFAIPTRAFVTSEERLAFVRQINEFRAAADCA